MFAASAMPVERPADWRSNSFHHTSRSAYASPAGSRSSSFSSIASAQTEPGLVSDRSRNSSAASTASVSSSRSGFKSLFGKKEKKPKEKKDVDKIILTSKHAAAVKTKMMLNGHYKVKPLAKTASVVGTVHTGHLSAAQQEARHPHSGPPALHAKDEMPHLTRIASGDERDDEDEFEKLDRARLEWDMAKVPGFAKISEHEGLESNPTSAEQSSDEGEASPTSRTRGLSPGIERVLADVELKRPVVVSRNSYGGRFRKDANGHWKR